jgi:hypothetical protein
MIIPKEEFSHPAIVRVFEGQEEKYPTTKAKLDHSRKCLALCVENGYTHSIEQWKETVAALEDAEFAEMVHFKA